MALVLADRVLETTSVAGTGDASLSGAILGYQPFGIIGDGNTTYYTIVAIDDNGAPTGDWEVGIGTYVASGNKISRDTVLSSSNGGALVYFASGTKQIFLDLPSEELPVASGDVTGPASAVANNFAAFNLTTGKLIKDSGYNASSFATAAQGAKADTAVQPGSLGSAAYLTAGAANGVATLDGGGTVPTSQLPAAVLGAVKYQGTWNASTNTPTLASGVGTQGYYYVVSTAGSTNLDGITSWAVGDWAIYNGTAWQKIDNTDAVTSVNGFTGTVVLTASDVGATPATSGTSILYGNGTGGTSNVTVGTGLTFAGGTLASTAAGGDVVGPASSTDNAIARFDLTTGKLLQNSTVTIDDNGNVNQANAITFDVTPATLPTTPGTLYWDSADGNQTLSLIMAGGTATQQIGEETYYRIKASAAITEGQVVMFTGTVGASGGLEGAPASGLTASTASYVMGIATQNMAHNDWGYVTSFGLVRGIDTTGGAEAWVDGQILYYDPTVAGGLTKTLPSAPNAKVQVCAVVYAASNGSLFVRPSFGGALGQYEGDVQVTTPANGDLLIRNQTSGKWVNAPLTAGTGVSIGNAAGAVTVTNSAPDQTVAITGAGGAVVTGTYPNFTITTPSGTVTSVTGTAPVVSSGGATPAISISQATTSTDGYLSSTDWNTFNGKGNGTVTSVSGTAPVVSSGGATPAISMAAATTSVNGYLTSTDWNTFNGKYSTGGALGTPSSGTLSNCTVDGTNEVGFKNIPQNSQSAAYTLVLADSGKHIYHPSADTTARTWTIPANGSVAFPIGTAVTFVNDTSGGVITIAITTDTLVLSPAGTTGSRSLAANGIATAIKVTSTRWIISGSGLT